MKKKGLLSLILACSMAFGTAAMAGCNIADGSTGDGSQQEQPSDGKTVSVTGVQLTETKKEITAGSSATLTANVLPANATNKKVSWKSASSTVASVDQNGKVTAIKEGSTVITVTTEDGNKSATCTVTVKAKSSQGGNTPTNPTDPVNPNPSNPDPVKTYTVKFFNDGTLVETKTVNSGSKVTQPDVTKSGHIISGWTTSSTSGALYDFNAGVTANLELHAKWVVLSNSISYAYAGNECAAFEWQDGNPARSKVEYKLSSANSYTNLDAQLVRSAATSGFSRADVVGLKGNANYDFKITNSAGKTFTVQNMHISAYDRSGYAHFGTSSGVGAYNNDGTPKSGATIIYLTEENKNNVDGKGNSIAEYLGKFKNSTNSSPVIIRVIGTVGSATWKEKKYAGYGKSNPLTAAEFVKKTTGNGSLTLTSSSKTEYTQKQLIDGGFNSLNTTPAAYNGATCAAIDGLNSKISCKDDGDYYVYDSCWNDCTVTNMKNVTVEGIGEDAEIFQWGFTFKSSDSIEVRNIHFDDYTEDACSFEASETSVSSLSSFKHGNVWLHHNTFDEGKNYWDVCDEQDKGDGDGSTDFKGIKNITIAFNHYIRTHKTNLIGGGDGHSTASVTFHHNYYESCNQRMPLGRQANMHMYNNYYSGSTLYSISLRAGAYAFIENCYFTEDASDHYPLELAKGDDGKPSAKIVNCTITQSKIKNAVGAAYLYVGTDRNATVDTTDQRFAKNFDTDSSLFYYKNGKSDVTEMLTAAEVKTEIPKVAGVQKRSPSLGGGTIGDGESDGESGGTTTPEPSTPEPPTPEPPTPAVGQTVTVLDNFSELNGKTSYDIAFAGNAAGYLTGNKIAVSKTDGSAVATGSGNGLKIQSKTVLDFTTGAISGNVQLVVKLNSEKKMSIKVTVDGTESTLTADSDGNVIITLKANATYQIGKAAAGEALIASISVDFPNA